MGIKFDPILSRVRESDEGGSTPSGPVAASNVSVTPVGGIAAMNAQAALAELDSEKQAIETPVLEYDRTVVVRAASTANLTLSGTQTVDGVALVVGNYCLAKSQTTASQNGVYVVAAGAWTRAPEYDDTLDFNKRDIYVSGGTTNGGTWWLCATRNVTVGTTATTFAQIPNGIGTAADQAAAGSHSHTSIATTALSSIGAALAQRYTSRTATASTASTDLNVVFSGSTAAQVETMPDGIAPSNNSGRVITYVNNASVNWTLRNFTSNTLNGSSSDFTLLAGRWITVFNTADNAWVIRGYGLNGTEASGGGSGTVTSVSVVSSNGVSGTVANATTTPEITLSLGGITPSSVTSTGNIKGATLKFDGTGGEGIISGSLTAHRTYSFPDRTVAIDKIDGNTECAFSSILKGNASNVVSAVAGTDYVAPGGALGTPSSGTLANCTGLPVSGIAASTSTALGVGSIELGHASDTTIARVSAGVISVEGVTVPTISSTSTLTNKTIALGSNTVSGTIAQFNTACTDADFATLAGSEALTNKSVNGVTLSTAQGTSNFLRGDGTYAAPAGGSGAQFVISLADYQGSAIAGILGTFTAPYGMTLAEVTPICGGNNSGLPVGSNLIFELRLNSPSGSNILSSTCQVTTTESATNGQYIGTPVTSFTSASIADGANLTAFITSEGSTLPAYNPRLLLRFSA